MEYFGIYVFLFIIRLGVYCDYFGLDVKINNYNIELRIGL